MTLAKIIFSKDDFHDFYERRHFRITHNLADHPLLQMDRLRQLAEELPAEDVEMNAGHVSASLPSGQKPDHGLGILQAIDQLDTCGTWVGLKNVYKMPAYKNLIDELLECVAPVVEPMDPGMFRRQGFLFLTSPGSTVPFHLDPEHNFLLQVRGHKRVTMFDRSDRQVLTEQDLERHFMQPNRKIAVTPQILDRGDEILLAPGEGLHMPTTAPHLIRNDEISISFSVTFETPKACRRADLYRFNHMMRRFGASPRPVGSSMLRDKAKGVLIEGARKIKRRLKPDTVLYEM